MFEPRGKIEVLSKGICEMLPNLEVYLLWDLLIEEIEEDTFHACHKLQILIVHNATLSYIPKNLFKGLVNLESLRLAGGNLTTLDFDITDSKNLIQVAFYAFNLSVFRPEILREQRKLEHLRIMSNQLFNLDIDQILRNAPNMKKIDLADNNFKCSRLEEILDVLKAKNIEATSFIYPKMLKNRTYIPEKRDEIHCLTEEERNDEFKHGNLQQIC